jgi:hypothetical protein
MRYSAYSLDSMLSDGRMKPDGMGCEIRPRFRGGGQRVCAFEIAALAGLLRQFGPQLRRPHCDTLNGSKHANMKELRFTLPDSEWRIAFAFDPQRQAILLVGGSKSGTNEKQFYRDLIRVADERFNAHLKTLPRKDGGKG